MIALVLKMEFLLSQTNQGENQFQDKDRIARMKTIVIRGSRYGELAQRATYRTDVILREDIQQSGATSIQALLKEKVAGIQSLYSGGYDFISMQGLDSRYIKIFLDGVPLTGDIYALGLPLENIALEKVERIEVSRGGGSASYGSDAFAGIIRIFTHKKQSTPSLGFYLDHRYDFKNEYTGTGALFMNKDKFAWEINGGGQYDDGAPVTRLNPTRVREFTWYELPENISYHGGTRFSLKGRAGQFSLQARYRYHKDYWTAEYPALGSGRTEKDSYAGSLHWKKNVKGEVFIKSHAAFSGYVHDRYQSDAHTRIFSNGEIQIFSAIHSETTLRALLGKRNELITGFEYEGEWLKYDGIVDGLQNDQSYSLFIENKFMPLRDDRLVFQPGLRLTYNPQYVLNLAPMLALKYQPLPWLALRASHNYNYKTPKLKQKYRQWIHPGANNFLLQGNTSLKPERGHSYQGSLNITAWHFLNLGGELFYHQLRDVIDSTLVSTNSGVDVIGPYTGMREYRNFSKGFSWGTTASLSGEIKKYFRYATSYTYTETKNHEEGEWVQPVGLIRHSVKFTAGTRLPVIKTDLNFLGQWHDGEKRNEGYAPKGWIVDFSFAQPLFQHYTLYGGIKNLFNNTEEAYDLYDGVTFYLGFKMHTEDLKNTFKYKARKWNGDTI